MKLLLIEPDKVLARTYSTYLRREGHSVRTASDAQAAVHAIDMDEPDLIILELQLPRHNGVEFLYELRSYADWQRIPVLVHTMLNSNQLDITSKMLTALGVIKYVYKPATSLSSLGRAIREAAHAESV